MEVLVTGAGGFIGQNLMAALGRLPELKTRALGRTHTPSELEQALSSADFVFHLAGVNRPDNDEEFRTVNAELTERICQLLQQKGKAVPVVLASSIQAGMDNPYGISKRQAEDSVTAYNHACGAHAAIYRLKNVFGKWCRPNYNSVVATFCNNVARDLPVTFSDPDHRLELLYIDDAVAQLVSELERRQDEDLTHPDVKPVHEVTLGRLLELIRGFRQTRQQTDTPDLRESFTQKLYAKYLSHVPEEDLVYALEKKVDARGVLAEFARGECFGQLFVSRTAPGVTRGNHYHDTKTEKFLLLAGEAVIRMRRIGSQEVAEYRVKGEELRVVDIPPGLTHSIENVGTEDLITLFWASEEFDQNRPDTYAMNVLEEME